MWRFFYLTLQNVRAQIVGRASEIFTRECARCRSNAQFVHVCTRHGDFAKPADILQLPTRDCWLINWSRINSIFLFLSITLNYSRCNCFFNRRRTSTPLLIILEVDIKPHKTLFEDVKNLNSSRQIKFTAVTFVILCSKMMDCTHDIDHMLSRKRKKLEPKKIYLLATYWITILLKLSC